MYFGTAAWLTQTAIIVNRIRSVLSVLITVGLFPLPHRAALWEPVPNELHQLELHESQPPGTGDTHVLLATVIPLTTDLHGHYFQNHIQQAEAAALWWCCPCASESISVADSVWAWFSPLRS